MSVLLPFIVLACGGLLLVFALSVARDWLFPPVVLVCCWTVMLFIATLDVPFLGIYGFFGAEISGSTWLALVGSITSFVIGGLVAYRSRNVRLGTAYTWDDARLRQAIFICFLAGAAAFSYAVIRAGDVPHSFGELNYLQQVFRPKFWGNFFALLVMVIVLAAVRMTLHGWASAKISALLAAISAILLTMQTQRVDLIEGALFAAGACLMLRRGGSRQRMLTRKLRRSVVTLVLSVLVLLVVFIRVGRVRGLESHSTTIVSIENPALAQLYLYSGATAVKNFQRVLNDELTVERKWGLLLLRPVLWWFGDRDALTIPDVWTGPNTATWLLHYYVDFGLAGALLVPFVLGLVCATAYSRARRGSSVLSAISFGMVLNCILQTTNGERFFEPVTLWYLVLFLLVDRYCRKRANILPSIRFCCYPKAEGSTTAPTGQKHDR